MHVNTVNKKITKTEILNLVSGNYLSNDLQSICEEEGYRDINALLDEDEDFFFDYLVKNAWQGLEGADGKYIWELIDSAAFAFESFLKEKGVEIS